MNNPKIRLRLFHDEWKQYKVSDLFNNVDSGNRLPKTMFLKGPIPYVVASNENNGIAAYISEEQKDYNAKPMKLFPKNSITFSIDNPEAIFVQRHPFYTSNIMRVLHNDNFNYEKLVFIAELIRKLTSFYNWSFKFSGPVVMGSDVMMPSKNNNIDFYEIENIGSLLSKFDDLIKHNELKLENLKNIKRSFLQKMFPKKGKKIPEVRFKGFEGDWKKEKLGNYIIEYTETTTKNNQYPVLTSSRKGIFFQKDYFAGNQIASADNTGYNIVPYGYFTYRHMSDDEIFHFNINDITEYGIVSTLYPVFTTSEDLDSKYLQYQLNYGYEFAKFALLQKQGGSRTYMYLSKLKEVILTIPTTIEEQRKIASFLLKMDKILEEQQIKIEKLKNLKQSLLEKMFI